MSCWTFDLSRLRESVRNRLNGPPVLIGHSHSKVIFEAAARAGTPLNGFNFWTAPQPALNAERTAFHPEIERTLSRGVVFSAVGGSAHNVLALVGHPRPFDFVLPAQIDLPLSAGAEILPFDAMRQAMAAAVAEYLQIIGLVRAAATGRMFHLEAPPPLEDGDRILPDVPWMFFRGLTREVAPAMLRYKCWRLHSDLVGEFCSRNDIKVIPPPSKTVDGRGFLRPAYYADAMHVNEHYGALVLRQIRQAI